MDALKGETEQHRKPGTLLAPSSLSPQRKQSQVVCCLQTGFPARGLHIEMLHSPSATLSLAALAVTGSFYWPQ